MKSNQVSPHDVIKIIGRPKVEMGLTLGNVLYLPREAYNKLSSEQIKAMVLDYMLKTDYIEIDFDALETKISEKDE